VGPKSGAKLRGGIGLHFGLFLSTTSTMLGRKESVDVPKTFVAFLSLHGCLSGKGRLFRPLGITLGLWFGNLWLGIGMGAGNASLFTSGHFWLGLGTWAWVWAGRHYLEIDPRMREITWVGG
jgi:hypothetical protein